MNKLEMENTLCAECAKSNGLHIPSNAPVGFVVGVCQSCSTPGCMPLAEDYSVANG